MVHFDYIFDIFSLWCNQIVLIHFAYCQTAPVTSLEYPHHMHLSIFGPFLRLYWLFQANLPLVDSICISSHISWDKFRVPTTHTFRKNQNHVIIFKIKHFGPFQSRFRPFLSLHRPFGAKIPPCWYSKLVSEDD